MITVDTKEENKECLQEYASLMVDAGSTLSKIQAGEKEYSDSLGWFDTKEWTDDAHLSHIEEIASKVRQSCDAFVLIGVGGSNNAARSVIEALPQKDAPKIIYAGNTLSPNAMHAMLEQLEGKDFAIDCIAKNFETLEPGASFRVLRKVLKERYGDKAKDRIIATGTPGSSLEKLCTEQGYTFLAFPEDVGGRYTAMTNVGLLPMAVAGIDIRSLVKGAADMQKLLQSTAGADNPAYRYACMRNIYYRHGYRVELLSSFEPQLRYFYKWWTQLFAESEGKNDRGLFPACCEFSEDLHSMGQFIQDGTPVMFETFLTVKDGQEHLVLEPDGVDDGFAYLDGKDFKDINEIDYEATIGAHSRKIPCMHIEIDALDAYHFGQLFYFYQYACYISAKILGVNPFDQPGVEDYKQRLFNALGK